MSVDYKEFFKRNENSNIYLVQEHIMYGLKKRKLALDAIPSKFKTREICEYSLTGDKGYNFNYIPEHLRDFELVVLAVKNGLPITSVPKQYITYEICLISMQNKGILENVPFECRSREICDIAMKKPKYDTIKYIPQQLITDEYIIKMLKTYPDHLFQYNIDNYIFTNFHKFKSYFTNIAEYNWRYIPEEFKDREFYIKYSIPSETIFTYIPNRFQTEDFYIELIKKNYNFWFSIPSVNITQNICDALFALKSEYVIYFPQQYIQYYHYANTNVYIPSKRFKSITLFSYSSYYIDPRIIRNIISIEI